jgi:hypothetical protein
MALDVGEAPLDVAPRQGRAEVDRARSAIELLQPRDAVALAHDLEQDRGVERRARGVAVEQRLRRAPPDLAVGARGEESAVQPDVALAVGGGDLREGRGAHRLHVQREERVERRPRQLVDEEAPLRRERVAPRAACALEQERVARERATLRDGAREDLVRDALQRRLDERGQLGEAVRHLLPGAAHLTVRRVEGRREVQVGLVAL